MECGGLRLGGQKEGLQRGTDGIDDGREVGRSLELSGGWESQGPGGGSGKGHFQEMAGPGKRRGRGDREGRWGNPQS